MKNKRPGFQRNKNKRFGEKKQRPAAEGDKKVSPREAFLKKYGPRKKTVIQPVGEGSGKSVSDNFFRILREHLAEPQTLVAIDRSFQGDTIDAIYQGKDILLSAPLGAGKTHIVYEMVKHQRVYLAVPTKALANNVYAAAKARDIPCKLTTGDFEIEDPNYLLAIGTAEKISQMDFQKGLVFIDEASWIFDEERGIPTYLDFLRERPNNQYVLMSGTIEEEAVQTIFERLVGRPLHLVKSKSDAVAHFYNPYVPRNFAEWDAVPKPSIIFCDDKFRSRQLVDQLIEMGFKTVLHHSSLNLLEKVKNETFFGTGKVDFLVGTSGIAYGINTPTQSVVLYDTGSATDITIAQILGRAGRPGYWARGFAFGAKKSPELGVQQPPVMKLGVRDRCSPPQEFFAKVQFWERALSGFRFVERKSWHGRIAAQYLEYTENDVPIETQETVFDLIEAGKPIFVPKLLKGKSFANDSTTLRWTEKLAKKIGNFVGIEEAQVQFERQWKVQAALSFLSEFHAAKVESRPSP